ncbi:MAG: 16S rRNA (guanine(527)-N(7))-methyltransferase RsmG [Clostridiales bacterium]|nr:16S rRNA (guanine(527)-N(7))-methyltransferase RsmG [Clostridiales bacterium]MDR2750194.1 16S rRNA (guanine(527)-N(7))-methyltransferase RsmG [Clostridiales bacterium]
MEYLKREAENLGVALSGSQLGSFEEFSKLLFDWNEKVNLTAITDPEEVAIKHYADSLSVLPFIKDGDYCADVGTGAGFPGIPLAIMRPGNKFHLLDSLNKRVLFLNAAIAALGLANVSCEHSRAEDAAKREDMHERFDVAMSRAVAGMPQLSAWCLPFVKAGGVFLAMKGPAPEQEAEEAKEAIKVAGGRLESIEKVSLAGGTINHTILVVRKVRSVPVLKSKRKK